MDEDVDDFLAHFGIKGMRWGRRNASGTVGKTSSSATGSSGSSSDSATSSGGASEKKRMSPETKKKIAIGVGIVGAAAIIAAGAYATNKHIDANKLKTLGEMRNQVETRRKGEAVARKQFETYNQKAKWKPSTHSKANREGKRNAAEEIWKIDTDRKARQQAFAERASSNRAARETRDRRINSLTSSGRAKNRSSDIAKTRSQIDALAKRSKWEVAASSRPKTSASYSSRDAKKDSKLYGDKGASRIQKNVDKGMTLSSARQKEAVRQNGVKATRIALNIGSAQRRESKEYDRLRRRN